MPRLLTNVVAFQIGWFGCVLGAAYGLGWLGPALAAALIGLHLTRVAEHPGPELAYIVTVGIAGAALDTALALLGVFWFRTETWPVWLCPPWLLALWLVFATTLRHSLGWLAGRPLLAAGLGLLGGPLSYYAGARLGAVNMPADPAASLMVLALVWAVVMPLLTRVPRRAPATAREFN